MKIDITQRIGDGIPNMLWVSHIYGATIKSSQSSPCSFCKEMQEKESGWYKTTDGRDSLNQIRTHFHGSDFGSCKRKVFWLLKNGVTKGMSNAVFLQDGLLHEGSILDNIATGIGSEWKIKIFKNTQETIFEYGGFQIIGHQDALLLSEDEIYLLECKAVKEYNFRKIREEGDISKEWYGQMQGYMLVLNLDRGYLIVKHRETSQLLMPIRIDRDNEFIAERLTILDDIYKRLNLGLEQPDREHKTSKDFECMYCPFGNNVGDGSCWN